MTDVEKYITWYIENDKDLRDRMSRGMSLQLMNLPLPIGRFRRLRVGLYREVKKILHP